MKAKETPINDVKIDAPPAPAEIQIIGLPLDFAQELHDALRELPHRQADKLIRRLGQLQIYRVAASTSGQH